MNAIDHFDYKKTRQRARNLLRRLNWNLSEEGDLIEDMVQNAALALIVQNNMERFSFIIGKAMMDTVLEWRFNVPAASHRTRMNRGTDNKEIEYARLDFSNFKLYEYSLDVERIVMARECIEKLMSGDLEQKTRYVPNVDIEKRRAACNALLQSGSGNICDGKGRIGGRNFGHKVLKNVRRLAKKVISDYI